MTDDRITIRLAPADTARLAQVAANLRAPAGRGAFLGKAATLRAALVAADVLARDGVLTSVLAQANKPAAV